MRLASAKGANMRIWIALECYGYNGKRPRCSWWLCLKSTLFRAWLRWALLAQSPRLYGSAGDANKVIATRGLTMRIWICHWTAYCFNGKRLRRQNRGPRNRCVFGTGRDGR